ncbi:MAG: T9SS type A sorting domain-containing protein [Candidatus Kapaibacterium sp.]
MKRTLVLILLLASSTSIVNDACYSQSLDLLTGLHPRPQVSYFLSKPDTFHYIIKPVVLRSQTASAGTLRAVAYLERRLKQIFGDTLAVEPVSNDSLFVWPYWNFVVIGDTTFPLLADRLSKIHTDTLNRPESYILDIRPLEDVLLAGADSNGTFNAVATFVQLLQETNGIIPSLHIFDWPDYPIRWVFSTHNLIVPSQISDLETIEDSMAAHKLNGLQQNDFKNNIYSVFENSYPQYFYNVDSLQAYSAKTNVELIPGLFPIGWSEGILFHDPDLAEGIPTTCTYYIEGDNGRLIGDARVALPNGNFENASNGRFPGWNWYDPTIFVDSNTVHSGRYSSRATNFTDTTPNGRFIKMLLCNPHSGYHMSAWVKTQGFSGEYNLLAIGFHGASSQTLTFTAFSVPATTNGWQQCNVIFNTLGYDSLYVYCGVWSGQSGTIWMDDFQIEDAGMTNLLRRTSDLPSVTGKAGSYAEDRDYAMLVDSVMEKDQGSYPCHASPGFKVLPGSKIQNGDTVQVHFIRPNPTINDPTGDGSTMVCVSEDTLYPILHDQMALVDAQYHSNKYFMSHDEIREMNWDSACQNRKLTPAQLLADNVRKCDSIMHEVHPGAEVFDWSDMFDSLHNAHDNYYLVNGNLSGDWNLIPKDFTIVNWNGGNMSRSLNFFSKLGFSQITSPYYDVQNTNNIRAWRLAMDTIPNMRGMMYTTWASDYSFLTPFADYAWSAGPMIVFQPLDSLQCFYDTIAFDPDVFSDPYLATDSITKVFAIILAPDLTDTVQLLQTSSNHYSGTYLPTPKAGGGLNSYVIRAINAERLVRTTPNYQFYVVVCDQDVLPSSPKSNYQVFPNPASNTITVRGTNDEPATILIEDFLGREVARFEASSNTSILDIRNIPAGIYECIITDASGKREAMPFVKE